MPDARDEGRSPKRDTQGTGPLGGCGQSPPFSPRDGGGIWQSRAGPKDGLRYGWAIRNVLSGKGAFSPIRRRAQRRTCISIPCRLRSPAPVLPARLPALPERQTAPQHAFPRKPAKIRRATQQRLCPTGANSVVPAPPQRPLPGRARQRRPTRAVPARHPSSTSIVCFTRLFKHLSMYFSTLYTGTITLIFFILISLFNFCFFS